MKKLLSLCAAAAFMLWILPLGAFIKPSQEKTACGGGRAFHMCSMMQGETNPEPSSTISFSNASGLEKMPKASGGSGGNDLTAAWLKAAAEELSFRRTEPVFIFTPQSFHLLNDPVPKA